jgi:signal transduction histidine kinase
VESGGDFLAIAAHELKTPLTAIKGGTQLLQRRVTRGASPMSDRDIELLQMVAGQVDTLTGMVDNLLEASRIVRGGLEIRSEMQNLSDLIQNIVREFAVPPGTTFAAPDSAVHARYDSHRVTQIMRALLQNAADAKPTEPVGVSVRATGSTAQVTSRTRDGESSPRTSRTSSNASTGVPARAPIWASGYTSRPSWYACKTVKCGSLPRLAGVRRSPSRCPAPDRGLASATR